MRKMFDFQLFVNVVCCFFIQVLSQTFWTSDSKPGKRKTTFSEELIFEMLTFSVSWNKLE